MKAQPVRVLDFTILGPLMIYIAMRRGTGLAQWERLFLGATGAATIGYNLANYIALENKGGCECAEK